MRINLPRPIARALLIAALGSVGIAILASNGTANDLTAQKAQKKIQELTQQIEQMKQEKAALTAKLQAVESKAPAAAASPAPPLSSPSVTGPLQMASPTEID